MKRVIYVLACLSLLVSCKEIADLAKDIETGDNSQSPTPVVKESIATGDATSITAFTAVLEGFANPTSDMGQVEMGIVYSANPNFSIETGTVLKSVELDGNNRYTVLAKELVPLTTYYYKSFLMYGGIYRFGEQKSFKTDEFTFEISEEVHTWTFLATLHIPNEAPTPSIWYFSSSSESAESDITQFLSSHRSVESLVSDEYEPDLTGKNEDGTYTVGGLIAPKTTFLYFIGVQFGESLFYSDINSVTSSPVEEWVDLGLSVLWRSYNLGASKPEEVGDYYAWGETSPKESYGWDNYRWGKYTGDGEIPDEYNGITWLYDSFWDRRLFITKYCLSSEASLWGGEGQPDGFMTLQSEDDAAYINGFGRMPSWKETSELLRNTDNYDITYEGISGCLFVGNNYNAIFVPVVSFEKTGVSQKCYAYYWTSTLNSGSGYQYNSFFPIYLGHENEPSPFRSTGLPIRPVKEP